MSWKKIEYVIREFANSLDSDLQTEKAHSIGGQIEYFKFTDSDELAYEFKLSKNFYNPNNFNYGLYDFASAINRFSTIRVFVYS